MIQPPLNHDGKTRAKVGDIFTMSVCLGSRLPDAFVNYEWDHGEVACFSARRMLHGKHKDVYVYVPERFAEQLETGRNYRFSAREIQYVLRISDEDAWHLGIPLDLARDEAALDHLLMLMGEGGDPKSYQCLNLPEEAAH